MLTEPGSAGSNGAVPPVAQLEHLYRTMATITACETATVSEVRAGKLNAAVYPVKGLEAVCAALGECLAPSDSLVSTYRNLGDAIAKGVPLREIIAESYGRTGGTSKGKGGPMHLADVDHGLMVTSGVVGGGVPIAVGLALAAQRDGQGAVTAVTFGDGATSIGATHEALNLAALWRVPVVFVCQNNQWGEHTPLRSYAANPNLAERAAAYGMRSVQVDGFAPLEVLSCLGDSVRDAREGRGPVFVEALTYRLGPHSAASDWSYMPKEEFAAASAREPTPAFRQWLSDTGTVSVARLDEIDAEVAAAVADAMEAAVASPWPTADEVMDDVFADDTARRLPSARWRSDV